MSTKSSVGTIPEGWSLYSFEYPAEKLHFIGRPEGVFFEDDQCAFEFGRREGAIKIIHVLSGREIKC